MLDLAQKLGTLRPLKPTLAKAVSEFSIPMVALGIMRAVTGHNQTSIRDGTVLDKKICDTEVSFVKHLQKLYEV